MEKTQERTTEESNFRIESGYERSMIHFPDNELHTPVRVETYTDNIALDPPAVLSGPVRGQHLTTGGITLGGAFFPMVQPGRILTGGKPKGSTGKP